MKEKAKPQAQKTHDGGGFGGPFDQVPSQGTDAVLKNGQYMEKLPIAGLTVGAVRTKYKSTYNIHDQSVSIINKKQVDDQTVINEGQTLTFIHKSGEKG